jgi:ribokinase
VAGANAELDAGHVRASLAARSVDVVIAQLETPQEATAAAFASARSMAALTIINPAPAAALDGTVLDGADWIVANESEFALLHGVDPDERSVLVAAAAWGSGVVVTLGAKGALLVAPGETAAVVPAPPADAVDTTGAGDAFVGTFAVTLAAGYSPVEAVRAGCAAGSLSVRSPGAQTSFPTADDLLHSSVW